MDYSKFIKSKVFRESVDAELSNPEIKSLRSELAVIRTFVSASLARVPDDLESLADLSTDHMVLIMTFVREVTHLVNAMTSLEHKLEVTITANDINVILTQVVETIAKHVQDDSVMRLIVEELDEILIRTRTGKPDDDAGTETGEAL